MKRLIKTIPLLAAIGLYFWAMADEFGLILGLHLTFLASSFFILFSPITSIVYLLGFLPGAIVDPTVLSLFSLHIFSLLLNVVTIYYAPVIYNRAFVCKVLYSMLTSYPTNLIGIGFSAIMLLYHSLVSKINSVSVTLFLHLVGLAVSIGTLYFVRMRYNDDVVWFMVDMSNANY